MLPVCPYLGLKIRVWKLRAAMHVTLVFIRPLTSILAEKLQGRI